MSGSTQELTGTLFHHAGPIDRHCQQHLLKPNPRLDAAVTNSKAKGLPDITVSALQGQELAIQCRLLGAKSVLEVGTLGGYSTIWLASTGAHVTSIELNPKHRDVALENLKGLDNVDVVLGSALDILPRLADQKKVFDFVFIDADWDEQWLCFDWAVKLTRPGGCIYVDNVVRQLIESDLIAGEDKVSIVTKAGSDPRVTATLIPTVGAHKGPDEMFDGHVLAIVN